MVISIFQKKLKACLLIVSILFLFLSLAPVQVSALSFAGIGIKPSPINGARDWFIYHLGPGESAEDYIEVLNDTESEQHLLIRPYDSEASNIGAFALTGSNNIQEGIGVWVKMEEEEVTLAPGERKNIKFTITIPENADVGEHSGAITVMASLPKVVSGFNGAAISTRVGARVYNTVPGEMIRKAKITSFAVSENIAKNIYEIFITAKNEGNITISPQASLRVGGWGLLSRTKIFYPEIIDKEWQLLRGAEVTTNWVWPKPYFGRFTFQAILTYDEKENVPAKLTTETLTVTIIPWRDVYILLATLLGIILIIVGIILYKKKKYSGKGWDDYIVKETDNVMSLAQKCHIPWKLLVKVNRIKKPYFMTAGQVILVPADTVAEKSSKSKKTHSHNLRKDPLKKKDKMKGVFLVAIIILTTIVLGLGVMIFIKSIKSPPAQDENLAPTIQESPPPRTEEKKPDAAMPAPAQGGASTTTPKALATSTSTITPPIAEDTKPKEVKSPLDKAKVKVSILNGSGTLGLAGVYAKKLGEAGFSSVTTGNAKAFDYKDAEISYKDGQKEAADLILAIMRKDYPKAVSKVAETLDADIVVIVGKK